MRFAAILGFVLLASGGTTAAAERGAAAGSASAVQALTQAKAEIGDVPGHELTQAVADEELKTPDKIAGVSFDGAKAKVFRQADLVNGSGAVRGYAVWEAKDGQKLFLIFGYTVRPFGAAEEFVPFEGTFEWIGGTGGLKNVRGKGTIEGQISRRGETRYRWAGSYAQTARK